MLIESPVSQSSKCSSGYIKLGVSSTKYFHSRILIFESCQYSTESQIICLGRGKIHYQESRFEARAEGRRLY